MIYVKRGMRLYCRPRLNLRVNDRDGMLPHLLLSAFYCQITTYLKNKSIMKTSKKLAALIALACATMMSAQAQETAQTGSTFINPDWANSAWYMGAGIGQSRGDIPSRQVRGLTSGTQTVTSFTEDTRDVGGKLFIGKQLSRHFAIEASYYDLGEFNYRATTNTGGVLASETELRGGSLDLVAQLPLTQRLSLLGRGGLHYTKATTSFTGNRLNALGNPNPPNEARRGGKFGVGAEYKFTEALAVRAEVERMRLVADAAGNRGDVDFATLSLVYKFGRPAAVPTLHQSLRQSPHRWKHRSPRQSSLHQLQRQRRKKCRSLLKRCSTSTSRLSSQKAKLRWTK